MDSQQIFSLSWAISIKWTEHNQRFLQGYIMTLSLRLIQCGSANKFSCIIWVDPKKVYFKSISEFTICLSPNQCYGLTNVRSKEMLGPISFGGPIV